MIEWMHDPSVNKDLRTNFSSKTLADCCRFISTANNGSNINLAIVEDNDEYLGTISLKHIKNNSAEFAISIRNKAMGRGIAADAMRELIRIAFEEKNIKIVYWCVSPKNERAIRFYDKNGYMRDDTCKELIQTWYTQKEISEYIWYAVRR